MEHGNGMKKGKERQGNRKKLRGNKDGKANERQGEGIKEGKGKYFERI